jgi:hypothetical protein
MQFFIKNKNIFHLKINVMKSLFMLLTILSFYLAKAAPVPGDIAPAAVVSFEQTFKEATNSEWMVVGDLFRVKFNFGTQLLYAFYNAKGERICICRTVSLQQLPPMLQAMFLKDFSGSVVVDSFEVAADADISYYVTVIKDNRKITLRSVGITDWAVYNKGKNLKPAAINCR